ncbi:MAG: hypothetical protein WCO56_29525, partial [Verrucomicrobiota bacterium]
PATFLGNSKIAPGIFIKKPSQCRKFGYVGVTLWSHTGQPIGLIAVIGRRPLANRPLAEATLKLVAVRAAGELERMSAEAERDHLIQDLQHALAHVKSLSGLLPICAGCKKIRDDKGYWNQVESYITKHSEATFTHGLCPDCSKQYFPDLDTTACP